MNKEKPPTNLFFPASICSFLPENMPPGPFNHTNLSGTEGKNVSELPQSQYEKACLELLGLQRTDQYIETEHGIVSHDPQGNIGIFLNNDGEGYVSLEEFINKHQEKHAGNVKYGLRINRICNLNGANRPFAAFESLDDKHLIIDPETKHITGLLYNENEKEENWDKYDFNPGDKVELFIEPKPVICPMYNPHLKESVLTKLGGGFVFQLAKLETNGGKHQLVTMIEATTNDVNIRNIGATTNKNNRHEFFFNLDINEYELSPASTPHYSLEEYVSKQDISGVLNCVVTSFVNNNAEALKSITMLTMFLHPEFNTHALKCHYCISRNKKGELEIITYAFDPESSVHASQQWLQQASVDKKIQPTYSHQIEDNPRLDTAINQHQAIYKKRTPTMQLAAGQMTVVNMIPPAIPGASNYIESSIGHSSYAQHVSSDIEKLKEVLPEGEIGIIDKHWHNHPSGWTKDLTTYVGLGRLLEVLYPNKNHSILLRRISSINLEDIQTFRMGTGYSLNHDADPMSNLGKQTLSHERNKQQLTEALPNSTIRSNPDLATSIIVQATVNFLRGGD